MEATEELRVIQGLRGNSIYKVSPVSDATGEKGSDESCRCEVSEAGGG